MKKFLYFANIVDGEDSSDPPSDTALLLADSLVLMEIDNDGDSLEMHFKDVHGHLGDSTMIALTITQHSGPEVMSAITKEIAFGSEPMIVIADDVNSVFIDGNVTAVTSTITV